VSDGTYAASKDILVKTIDNAFDGLTVDAAFVPFRDDTFNTNGSGSMWITGSATAANTTYNQFTYNATTGAYSINVTAQAGKYRFASWLNNNRAEWLPYSSVGSTNYVRAKFYVYNSGSNLSTTAGTYSVPNFNLKLSQRFAVTAVQTIQTHDAVAADLPAYRELAPSTNVALPSLYRMDFDPIDVPFMATGPLVSGLGEGIMSHIEIFSLLSEDAGTIALTEEEIGTYPISALGSVVASQTYDNALLTSANVLDTDLEWDLSGLQPGDYPPAGQTFAGSGTMTNSASGVTFNTVATAANRTANLERTFDGGATTGRMRIAEDELYTIKWHLTSTRNVADQGTIWLKARTAKFGYTNYLQLAGGRTSGLTQNRIIAQQAQVGAGTANPDGGWYTIVMNTPLDGDIRSETNNPVSTEMPVLGNPALPGRGNAATSTYRDIRLAAIAYDTLSVSGLTPASNEDLEAVLFTLDSVVINAYSQIDDGGY
jgi:hypothetical protein